MSHGRRRWAAALAAAVWLLPLAAATAAAPVLTASERALIAATLQVDDSGSAPASTADDEVLWNALIRRATRDLGLRVEPARVDRLWAIAPPRRSVETELAAAREQGRLAAWLEGLRPAAAQPRALALARRRYARIVETGGWRPLADGPTLRLGDAAPTAADLRLRLAAEGYPIAAGPPVFDAALQQALTQFQREHDLDPDGVLGPETRAALNLPAEVRLAQIEANLERWRWLPPLPADRVEVDVAGAEAVLYQGGAPRLQMRAIVGDAGHPTPMFVSELQAVVFNPPWNVPTSIATAEILPKARRDPGYLARNGLSWVDGRLQQRPGPKNSLGRLKFDLPSPFGVYLHDTPGQAAFARRRRALSHGCVRLEQPRELAAALLADRGWTRARIDAAIDAGATERTPLARAWPLYVLYWTVKVDEAGRVQFRRDVYDWDAKLTRALAAADGAVALAAGPRPETECAASAGAPAAATRPAGRLSEINAGA